MIDIGPHITIYGNTLVVYNSQQLNDDAARAQVVEHMQVALLTGVTTEQLQEFFKSLIYVPSALLCEYKELTKKYGCVLIPEEYLPYFDFCSAYKVGCTPINGRWLASIES